MRATFSAKFRNAKDEDIEQHIDFFEITFSITDRASLTKERSRNVVVRLAGTLKDELYIRVM
jgi:hypothetical protein